MARARARTRSTPPAAVRDALARALLLPVRHHSPRAAAAVAAELARARPAIVLVEGPADADELIAVLCDPETRPPVAILGYRTDGVTQSVLWPFADYSPELVALRWAVANGVPARFIDLEVGVALAVARATPALEVHGDGESGEGESRDGESRDGESRDGESRDGESRDGESSEDDRDRDRDRDVPSDDTASDDGASADPDDDAGDPERTAEESADDAGGAAGAGDSPARARLDRAAAASADHGFAAAVGMRSFDEAWDALIEAPAHDAAGVRALLLAYAELVRGPTARDAARDAVMARHIAAAAREVGGAERVAVVVGAAHAAAFAAGDVDLDADAALPAPVPSAVTAIPYSFPRLAEQLGYGAGNRAPRYFQRAHDAGCDLGRATLETLVDLGEHLRLRGFAVSLADVLEAWRLATTLARIRGKTAPALDEAREAAIATIGRGDAGAIDAALRPAAIGRAVGKVAARVGPSALADEFWREVKARRLPASDEAEDFALVLNDPVQVDTSVFLHRLRLADVPYASWLGAGRGAARSGGAGAGAPGAPGASDDGDGLAALGRVREAWTAQWTPATDVALIEAIVRGSSLEEVAGRICDERLAGARTTGGAAEVLLDAVIARCPDAAGRALAACDARAAVDDDVPSLARAALALSGLASYGATRGDAIAVGAVDRLLAHTFERAVLRAPVAAQVAGDGIDALARALRGLHEVGMAQPRVDRGAWLAAARAVADDPRSAPRLAGLALGLVYLGGALGDDDVADALALRLQPANPPETAAEQLAGFVEVNALVVVKSRPVVAALDRFLAAIAADRLVDVLPVLRRALGALGPTERRYLLDNVIAVRGLGAAARAAAAVVDAGDHAALQAMDADLGAALDDLDDLL